MGKGEWGREKGEGGRVALSPFPLLISPSSAGPPGRALAGEDEELGGAFCGSEDAGHRLKGHDFFGRGVGIEVDGERFDQRWAVGTSQRLEPRVGVAQPPALQPNPDGAIEPARDRGEIFEQGFGKEETFAGGAHCAEPHLSTLVAAVKDGSPTVPAGSMMIPIQDPEELFSECVNYKR
jgi:hypothetical protein